MEIIAKTLAGLEEVLAAEVRDIGGLDIEIISRAVRYHGSKSILYKSNYLLRSALRVLVPMWSFEANSEDELYDHVYEYDWPQWISPSQTFAIDSVVSSDIFTHSKYIALKTKDAIVDKIRDIKGERPQVELKHPDKRINLHIHQNQVSISLDSSGASLHRRGYRKKMVKAPINEVLGAGLILMTGYKGERPFYDPMCGSGTLAIEAARIAKNIPPQFAQRQFGFKNWEDFDETLWNKILDNAKSQIKRKAEPVFASDISPYATRNAEINGRVANLRRGISFKHFDFFEYKEVGKSSIIVVNPPYDERLKSRDIRGLYQRIGDHLKKNWTGCDAWVFSGNLDAMKSMGLATSKKVRLQNGAIPSLFAKYEMYKGTKRED